MRRRLLLLSCVALLATACSDDLVVAPATTEPAVAITTAPETAASPDTTAAPETTASPETTAAPEPPAAEAAPLVPEVICVDEGSGVHFGYDNQGSAVVVLDDADANVLSGTVPLDEPFVPTVFAPGRVSPVFRADAQAEQTDVTWELTGPDGITRSAAPDDDTPVCTEELLEPTTADTRTPALEVVSATFDPATDEVTVDIELTGVPRASVCNEAFEAEPAIIRLEGPDPEREVLAEGTAVTLTEAVFDYQTIGRAAGFTVAAVVIDRCSYDGTTFSAWPSGDFVALYNDPRICISVAGGEPEVVGDDCTDLPPTGGVKIRS